MKKSLGIAAAAVVAVAGVAQANIIVPMGNPSNASNITSAQYNAVEFTFTAGFNNLVIDASLVNDVAGEMGTAYLTNMIGPGTTAANVIASTSFEFAMVGNLSTELGWVSLFNGVDLGAGTYFLIFAAPFAPSTATGGISLSPGVTYDTDANASVGQMLFSGGANIDAGFAPASTFVASGLGNRFIRVTPTPSAAALLGVAGLMGVRRRR